MNSWNRFSFKFHSIISSLENSEIVFIRDAKNRLILIMEVVDNLWVDVWLAVWRVNVIRTADTIYSYVTCDSLHGWVITILSYAFGSHGFKSRSAQVKFIWIIFVILHDILYIHWLYIYICGTFQSVANFQYPLVKEHHSESKCCCRVWCPDLNWQVFPHFPTPLSLTKYWQHWKIRVLESIYLFQFGIHYFC